MPLKMLLTAATETNLWEITKRGSIWAWMVYSKEYGDIIHPVALVARDIYIRHWLCDKKQHKHPKYQSSIED
jgi:hypothetical protein